MEIFEKILVILSQISGMEHIHPEDALQVDLGFDSLQMVTLLIMLEDAFEILFDESDMNPFDLTTVSDVVTLVEKYINGGSHAETEKED